MKSAMTISVLVGALALAQSLDFAAAQTDAPAAPPAAATPDAPIPEAPLAPETATVRVTVENVKSDAGTIWVALCTTSLSVEGCPYQSNAPATVGTTEVIFSDIPPGTYAIAGYHDQNGNNIFDKFLGMPREPYAISGTAGDELVPSFADAALEIKPGENDFTIRLKRLGG